MKSKYSLLLIFIWLLTLCTSAQPTLNHVKKYYKSNDGKLYYNKHLPVYVYISPEPDGKGEMIQLQSDSTKKYANPMYLDTEGINTFRSPSAVDTVTKEIVYPMHDVIFEVYADGDAPHSKHKLNNANPYYKGNEIILGKGCSLEISSTDKTSGVDKLLVSIDSNGYNEYNNEIKLTDEKHYSINYYSVDNVGNVEKVQSANYTVDIQSPTTEINIEGDKFENTISGNTKITLQTTDNIAGVAQLKYSIDGKEYKNYTSPIYSKYLSEGEHTIQYYAVDNVGNEEKVKEYSFFIDKTPPVLVDEIMGNSYTVNGREYSSGRSKLKLTAIDNKAGVKEIKYSINNEPYMDYDKPFYLTSISGSLSVVSYAIDNVGNKSVASEKTTKSKVAYVDLSGPEIKYTFEGKYFQTYEATYINKDTKIKLSAYDSEAGLKYIAYTINNGAEISYEKPFSIEEGGHKEVNIYAYDNLDNSNRERTDFIVDNIGPDIYYRYSVLPMGKQVSGQDSIDVYPSHVVVFLSATDEKIAIDKIYYSVNGGEDKLYTGIVEGFKKGNIYSIDVKAYDKLGNVNTQTIKFATDNTGPEVNIRYSLQPISSREYKGQTIDVYPSHMSIFVSVINAHVIYNQLYYSINGGSEKPYMGIIDGFKPGSNIEMKIRAIDRLGNQIDKMVFFGIQ